VVEWAALEMRCARKGTVGSNPTLSAISYTTMDTIFVLSILVSIFSLALTLIGIPAQIIKNYRDKKSGQPLVTIIIAVGFYIVSAVYFALTRARFPLISFSIGLGMWGVTLVQYFIYRRP
jgi:hypothetical protein